LFFSPNIDMVIKSGRQKGRACSTHGRDEKCIQNFSRKDWREETTWET